jgi:HPt (histidine-containing phosphotransfer) domain-containing protein
MAASDDSPILSVHAADPAFSGRLEAFVLGLGEQVDRLQDLETVRDYKQLESDAHRLGLEAASLGFGELTDAAQQVVRDCRPAVLAVPAAAQAAGAQVRRGLIALTDVARRVRLGHRGSMP